MQVQSTGTQTRQFQLQQNSITKLVFHVPDGAQRRKTTEPTFDGRTVAFWIGSCTMGYLALVEGVYQTAQCSILYGAESREYAECFVARGSFSAVGIFSAFMVGGRIGNKLCDLASYICSRTDSADSKTNNG